MPKASFSTVRESRIGFIQDLNKSRAKFEDVSKKVKFSEILPFRVKFIQLDQTPYGPGNAAPIGIAIIGLNNYVM